MCQQIHNIEWSGTLFYTYEGNFEDGSLVIKCQDIFVMDIGTAAYTEFDMSPDVISYMTDNMELLDCQMGLIHSHNNMSTFMSDTDTATLREEGTDRNHFVSLIVNNAGKYTAGITRKVKSVKTISENFSYPTYEDGLIQDTKSYTVENEEIEWFNLDIEFEKLQNPFQEEIANRLEEIRKSKQVKAKQYPISKGYQAILFDDYEDRKATSTVSKSYTVPAGRANIIPKDEENDLPFDKSYWYGEDNDGMKEGLLEILYGAVTFDEETVQDITRQLITGSIIITKNSKIDLNQWAKGMTPLYEKRFGEGEEGMKLFKVWADNYIEFLCWYVENEELVEMGMGNEELAAVLAHDVIEVLTKLPENRFIKAYIDILEKYLI